MCVHLIRLQVQVVRDDGTCRSMSDVQLVRYIFDNLSVSENYNINLITLPAIHGQMTKSVFIAETCSAILNSFHLLVCLPLHNTVFFVLCKYSLRILAPHDHEN